MYAREAKEVAGYASGGSWDGVIAYIPWLPVPHGFRRRL